jgi:hypothetical protein
MFLYNSDSILFRRFHKTLLSILPPAPRSDMNVMRCAVLSLQSCKSRTAALLLFYFSMDTKIWVRLFKKLPEACT